LLISVNLYIRIKFEQALSLLCELPGCDASVAYYLIVPELPVDSESTRRQAAVFSELDHLFLLRDQCRQVVYSGYPRRQRTVHFVQMLRQPSMLTGPIGLVLRVGVI
jgi:hypothetical protein